MSTLTMTGAEALAPGIARDLEAGVPPRAPSFLNWVLEETERLRGTITPETTRDERFRIQNQIATLSGVAHGYGQWLLARSE